jgi:hypothetical protein
MTHATISRHDAICCAVRCDIAAKDSVKALAGATFDGDSKAWIVPTMHLPTLKGIFDSMTVAPEVISAYHELLRRMLCDTMTSAGRKGELGRHLAELHERHAVGIAHVMATGWQPTPSARPQHAAQPVPVAEAAPVVDAPDLAIWSPSANRYWRNFRGRMVVSAEARAYKSKRRLDS